MSFHLYLIRHGESANNALPESQRVEDPGLTQEGERQAKALAERFHGERVSHLLTSGFLRAVQTTRPLAQKLNLRPVIWTDLHEVGGCYAGYEVGKEEGRPGMNRRKLSTQFPEFHLPDDIDEQGWWRSQPYENSTQAKQRSDAQAKRLVSEFAGTKASVACVIHADFKALMIESLLSNRSSEFAPADLQNTGVTLLSYENRRFEMLDFNNVDHLSDTLPL